MNGYAGKILRINLSDLSFRTEEMHENLMRLYLGGSSLATKLLSRMNWQKDPFDLDSEIVFATGPITGTSAPSSARFVVAAKSPLTGGWGESHASGYWGPELKYAGFDAIVIKGRAERPTFIWIHDGQPEFKDASHLLLKGTYETEEIIRNELGDRKIRVLRIGPAGEKLSRIAAIINDHGRAAARGGLGAVMGSKNLKAIAVRGNGRLNVADKDRFEQLTKSLHKMVSKSLGRKALRDHGTNGGMEAFYSAGDVPIKNWTQGAWEEGIKNLFGPIVTDTILVGKSTCRGCSIGCGRIVEIKDGEYKGLKGKGPEYETIAAFGPLCLNDNLPTIVKAGELCDQYGLDSISTGATVAMVIECHEKGLLSIEDLDGLDLSWGNGHAIVALVEKIGKREGIGDLLAEGSLRSAKEIGNEAEEAVMHVKGLELAMHDPRAFSSWAVSYGTCPRGGCHIGAPTYWLERGITFPELGFPEALDPFSIEKKGEWTAVFQDFCEVIESMVICKFVMYGGVREQNVVDMITLCTGFDMDLKDILKIGERSNNIKRLINLKLGFGKGQDILPRRIRLLALKEGGTQGHVPNADKMLSEYYHYRGWNKDGIPSRKKFDELFLSDALDKQNFLDFLSQA